MEMDGKQIEYVDLTEFEEAYNSIDIDDRSLKDGLYQVNIERVQLTKTKKNNIPVLKWMLRVIGPTNEGEVLWHSNLIKNESNLKWLKTDLIMAGLRLNSICDLQDRLEELLDVRLNVYKKTNGDYTNIYIKNKIDSNNSPKSKIPF
jgi:hypothetical protein